MQEAAVVVDNVAQTMPITPAGEWWGMVMYCVVVFAIIYLFVVRPNKRRMAEYQKMLDGVQIGNRVQAAGIYGVVKSINDKTIELEIAKGVVVEMNKNTISAVE